MYGIGLGNPYNGEKVSVSIFLPPELDFQVAVKLPWLLSYASLQPLGRIIPKTKVLDQRDLFCTFRGLSECSKVSGSKSGLWKRGYLSSSRCLLWDSSEANQCRYWRSSKEHPRMLSQRAKQRMGIPEAQGEDHICKQAGTPWIQGDSLFLILCEI